MSDTVAFSLTTVFGRLPKWTRLAALTFAAIVLLALSFALGRATMDHAGRISPAIQPAAVQPAPSTITSELGCPYPGRC